MELSGRQKKGIAVFFVLYLAVLVYVLFFSARFGRTQGSVHGINLVPFREIKRFYKGPQSLKSGLFWMNIVGNIAAFFPMGLCVALLAPKRPYSVFALAVVYIACILAEVLQYVCDVGSLDIDDVILNTVGGLLGILVHTPVRRALAETSGRRGKGKSRKSGRKSR